MQCFINNPNDEREYTINFEEATSSTTLSGVGAELNNKGNIMPGTVLTHLTLPTDPGHWVLILGQCL